MPKTPVNKEKIKAALCRTAFYFGAGDGIRTRDPRLGKPMLYQLSYARVFFGVSAGCSLADATVSRDLYRSAVL